MNRTCRRVSLRAVSVVMLAAVVSVAATRLVAMRVEVEPVRAIGPDTIMTMVLVVAPEDRERIGRDVLLRAELRRGDDVVSRVTRTIELDDGSAQLDTPWPPGTYDLRVDVEGVGRDANGFWRGRIEVPRLEPEPTPAGDGAADELSAAAATGAAAATPGASGPEVSPPEVASTPEPEASADVEPELADDAPGVTAEPPRWAAEPRVETTTTAAAASVWGGPAPGETEVTVSVLDQARGVVGLGGRAFDVEVDGKPVALTAAGGAAEAPLHLVLCVDLSSSMTPHLPELRRQLTRLALEATASGGGAVLLTADAAPERSVSWDGAPDAVAEALATPGSGATSDLSRLVTDGVAAMSEAAGRRAMVLVTDGGDTAGRSEWSAAVDVAAEATGPVLVIAFRSDDLESRTARSLDRLAEVSGGDSWTLRDTSLLEAVLDAYREHLDGGYALRFQAPTESSRLKVEMVGGDWEVLHPERVH